MKKLLFGIAFMGAMMCTGLSGYGQASVDPVSEEMRWKNLQCTDGSGGTYEICWLTGDGNTCDTYGEKTRYCDPITD